MMAEMSLLYKVRHTPLRDMLRGRLTARLDIRARIHASDLPVPAKALIERVVRRTRLWRMEKLDVADELIAHFRDGLESGASVEELIEHFGDEKRAAKLIRRAKKRNRPLVWHAIVGTGWIILGLLAVYGLSALYFFTAKPVPSVDYTSIINSRIANVPEEDRAWPLYRQAMLKMGLLPELPGRDQLIEDLLEAPADDPRWNELTAWLDQHADNLQLVREASRKPAFGFILGPGGSAYDPQLWPTPAARHADSEWPDMIHLPHLHTMRLISQVLSDDIRHAREQGDSRRVIENVAALIGMADHLREHGLFINELISIGVRIKALEAVETTLQEYRDLLSRDELQVLAHMLATPDTTAQLIRFQSERLFALDLVQRVYSDDGQGSGRMTAEGYRYLEGLLSAPGRDEHLVHQVVTPILPLLMASRRELTTEINRLFDLADAKLHRPIRDAGWDQYVNEVMELKGLRFTLLTMMMPASNSAHAVAERYLGRRDGILVGIALELYRREHGRYPDSLEELTPLLLPTLPEDRFTGEPVKYRIIDGHAVVYSVGADRVDDGGQPALDRTGQPNPLAAADFLRAPDKVPPGDWILYTTVPVQ